MILKKQLNGMDLKLDNITSEIKNVANNVIALKGAVQTVTNLGVLSVGMQAMNLVVTAGGFAIMNSKLNSIIESIGSMQETLNQIAKKQEMDIMKEFNELRGDYADMLDADKRQESYKETDYYKLTRKMHSMIDYLYACFMSDAVENKTAILEALYVLLPMYANVLRKYDREYYFNYKDKIHGGSLWHSSHEEWMNSFGKMIDAEYLEKFQDYCFLEEGMSGRDADDAVLTAYLTAVNSHTIVEDNQKILLCFDTREEYNQYQNELIEDAQERINESMKELDEETISQLQPAFAKAAEELAAAI